VFVHGGRAALALAAGCVGAGVLAAPGLAANFNGAGPDSLPSFNAGWPGTGWAGAGWPGADWLSAGNGASNDHFAPAEHILNRYDLDRLSTRWVFTARGNLPDTPTVEGGHVYVSDAGGSVWQIDAQTGQPIWEAKLSSATGNAGSVSRVSPAVGPRAVIVGGEAGATVVALSKTDGKPVWQTTLATDAGAFITGSPVVVGSRVYVSVSSSQESLTVEAPSFVLTFRGSVAALDLNDGHVIWQTYTVPQGFTGGAVWGSNLAVDGARHAVYASTGNNYSVPDAVAACQQAAATPAQIDACLPADDHIDSIVSLNSDTGQVNWGRALQGADAWVASCRPGTQPPATPCPSPIGPDSDFGSAPNLFSMTRDGVSHDVVGAGQKSGVYWALDRDTGNTLWATQVGPAGPFGGILWGTATDGARVYVPSGNSTYADATLTPSGQHTNGGFWSALDASTGQILWQTPTFAPQPPSPPIPVPAGALAKAVGSVSVANGVMYGGDTAGSFVALDAKTGRVLKSFQSGGASIAGPAVAGGTLYWGSGSPAYYGPGNNKLFALSLDGQ